MAKAAQWQLLPLKTSTGRQRGAGEEGVVLPRQAQWRDAAMPNIPSHRCLFLPPSSLLLFQPSLFSLSRPRVSTDAPSSIPSKSTQNPMFCPQFETHLSPRSVDIFNGNNYHGVAFATPRTLVLQLTVWPHHCYWPKGSFLKIFS